MSPQETRKALGVGQGSQNEKERSYELLPGVWSFPKEPEAVSEKQEQEWIEFD